MNAKPRFWSVAALAVHDGRDGSPVPLSDVAAVRAVLIAAARARRALSYAECLDALGYRFSRPRMRALCRTLDAIDASAQAAGEPELAVLVVRQTDGLPGEGWWTTRRDSNNDVGPCSGPAARQAVRDLQTAAFRFWAEPEGLPEQRGRTRVSMGNQAEHQDEHNLDPG